MLGDPNYQNVSQDEIGMMTSWMTLCAYPVIVVYLSFMGFVYEILGRKLTLHILFTLGSIGICLIPYSGSSIYWLFVTKALVTPLFIAISVMPLVMDYVKKEDRGKGVVLNLLGLVIGEALAYGGLMTLTSSMEYKEAFRIAGGCLFFWQIFIYLLVKEPDLTRVKKNKKERI